MLKFNTIDLVQMNMLNYIKSLLDRLIVFYNLINKI
jgi:hypothetical protein